MSSAVSIAGKLAPPPAASLPPATSKANSSKRSVLISLVFLALIVSVGWAVDGWLMIRLRLIANEMFESNGEWRYAGLNVDAVNELEGYSPSRLAACLDNPSAHVRRVICLALSSRRSAGDAESWSGVVPALFKAKQDAANDDDLQRLASHAIYMVKHVAAQDAEVVLEFANQQIAAVNPSWMEACHLLDVASASNPDLMPQVLATFKRSLTRGPEFDHRETVMRVSRMAPRSPEAAAAVLAYFNADSSPKGPAMPIVATTQAFEILRMQPEVVDQLLVGTPAQQAAAFEFASWHLNRIPTGGDRLGGLTAGRLELLKAKAKLAAIPKPGAEGADDAVAAFHFLSVWPENASLLLDAARRSSGARRASALKQVGECAAHMKESDAEALYGSLQPELLQWLADGSAEVPKAALSLILNSFDRYQNAKSRRLNADAPIVAACRSLLDKRPGPYDQECLQVLIESAAAIDNRDVDRVAAALERSLNHYGSVKTTDPRWLAGRMTTLHSTTFDQLAKHSTNPTVRQLRERRRALEDEGILR